MFRNSRMSATMGLLALAAVAAVAYSIAPDAVSALLASVTSGGAMLAWGPAVRTLQEQHAAEVKGMQDLAAVLSDRDLSAEEQAAYDAHKAKAASLKSRIATAMEAEAASAGLAPTDPAPAAAPVRGAGAVTIPAAATLQVSENVDQDPQRGFRSLGDYLVSVRGATYAQQTGQQPDRRLMGLAGNGFSAAAPSTFGNEAAGQDGGYLVPPGFSSNIFRLSLEEQALLPLTDNMPITGNSMTLPRDETTPWGSDGVRAYFVGEAIAATATKPVLGTTNYRLKKLMALVPMSEELMADGVALGAYFEPAAGRSIRWKTDESILFGAGTEGPLGAYTNTSLAVVVNKVSGQAAATLVYQNVVDMIARLPQGSYGRAVWLVNNDVLPQLFTMTNGNFPVWTNANSGAQQSPYGNLLGRPVYVTQHAKTLGTQGDIMLADFSMYRSVTKANGIQTDTSMHLYFDAAAVAFRAMFRVDGAPKLSTAITPANGSNNLSPFVQLQTRS